jgi:hypothetical protein
MLNGNRSPLRSIRILAGVVGAIAGFYAIQHGFRSGGVSVEDLKRYTIAGLSAELPAAPQPLTIPIPPEIAGKIISIENYEVKKRSFEAVVSRITYAADIEASAEGALDGSMANLMNVQKMTRLSQNRKPLTISGVSGLRYWAVFSKSGEELEMQGVVLTKGPVLWQLFVLFARSNTRSRDAAVRIADSVAMSP